MGECVPEGREVGKLLQLEKQKNRDDSDPQPVCQNWCFNNEKGSVVQPGLVDCLFFWNLGFLLRGSGWNPDNWMGWDLWATRDLHLLAGV